MGEGEGGVRRGRGVETWFKTWGAWGMNVFVRDLQKIVQRVQ